jgi:hypothetical protein
MAYDEALADRIRLALRGKDISERKMFGGLAFMSGGNMVCGVMGEDLMARVGPQAHDAALARPGARPMDFTGRAPRGMVYVGPAGYQGAELETWVRECWDFSQSLPAKKAPGKRGRTA